MSKWKACYSRGKKHEVTSWDIQHGLLHIRVVRGHRKSSTRWCFHCPAIGFDTEPLPDMDWASEAMAMALFCVEERIYQLQESIRILNEDTGAKRP